LGLSSVRAASAEAALEVLQRSQPKAIVLDLLLPGISGEELLAHLPDEPRRPPVVVSTVRDLTTDQRRSLEELGVVAVIQKGPGVASRVSGAVAGAVGLEVSV